MTVMLRVLPFLLLAAACSSDDDPAPVPTGVYADVALSFAKALANRNYSVAYAMTSPSYREHNAEGALRMGFEAMVSEDFGPIGAIEVGRTLGRWPGMEKSDAGWVYVSIGGEVYSEAVQVVVTRDGKIRSVEFGRP